MSYTAPRTGQQLQAENGGKCNHLGPVSFDAHHTKKNKGGWEGGRNITRTVTITGRSAEPIPMAQIFEGADAVKTEVFRQTELVQ